MPKKKTSARRDKTQKKSRGGAPKGNLNAKKHGGYLNHLRREKDEERERIRRKFGRNAREMIAELGVPRTRASRELAEKYADLKMIQYHITNYLDKRGWHTNSGLLKPSTNKLVEVINDQLRVVGRLLEALGKMGPSKAETTFLDLVLGADKQFKDEEARGSASQGSDRQAAEEA